MKQLIFLLLLLTTTLAFAGDTDSILCDSLSKQKADLLSRSFKAKNYTAVGNILNDWQLICPNSEIVNRAEIICNIIEHKPCQQLIENYFNSDYHFIYKNRMEYAALDDYQYLSEDYRTYFNYVPLRHPLDSALMQTAIALLTTELSKDEKLACTLFSGDVKKFEKESKKPQFNGSFVQKFIGDDKRYFSKENLTGHFYLGSYASADESKGFGTNPYFGFSLASPLKYKIQGELYFKFRLNINDKNFNYAVSGVNNEVNSILGFSIGLTGGYKIFENDQIIIVPKLSLGYEAITTGLHEYDEESESTFYHNVETLHSSIGLSILKPIFRRNYIGLEASYHYCPYGFDEDLISKFDNHAYSFEVFFRF